MEQKKISTTVDGETFMEIKDACKRCNISIAEFLRMLVENQKNDLYEPKQSI